MGDVKMENKFSTLYGINVNEYVEKKNGLTYLSWANAWAEFKKVYPEATYEVVKFDGKPYVYDENLGYMCYTTVTVEGLTHEMWLPVMDGANKAMKAVPYTYKVKSYGKEVEKTVQAATMFDINKTIMRCLTKNLAMFGLGLYIYAGEDLPEAEQPEKPAPYPSRQEMLYEIQKKYPKDSKNREALVNSLGVATIDDMTDAQVMAVYNKVHKP
jgi:hypothetical protein